MHANFVTANPQVEYPIPPLLPYSLDQMLLSISCRISGSAARNSHHAMPSMLYLAAHSQWQVQEKYLAVF